jgi:glycosyltransferase involved in cell wall biosynthesis
MMISKTIMFLSHQGTETGAPLLLIELIKSRKAFRPSDRLMVFFCEPGVLVDQQLLEDVEIFVSRKRSDSPLLRYKLFTRLRHYFYYISILVRHRPNLVFSNTSTNYGEVVLAGLLRISVVMNVLEGRKYLQAFRHRLKFSSYFPKQIVVGSHYVAQSFFSLTGRHGTTVYHGIDAPPELPFKATRGSPSFRVGMLGTIDRNKGQHIAIEALRILLSRGIEANLVVAGNSYDPSFRLELLSMIEQLSLNERICFLGNVPSAREFISSLDVLLVPSFDEAFPTVILESFAMGTAVVASNVGGIPEIVEHEVNGLLVEAGNAQGFSDAIERLILDRDLRNKFRGNAHLKVVEGFDIRNSHTALCRIIDANS